MFPQRVEDLNPLTWLNSSNSPCIWGKALIVMRKWQNLMLLIYHGKIKSHRITNHCHRSRSNDFFLKFIFPVVRNQHV